MHEPLKPLLTSKPCSSSTPRTEDARLITLVLEQLHHNRHMVVCKTRTQLSAGSAAGHRSVELRLAQHLTLTGSATLQNPHTFVAGRLSMAFASSASSLSNTGVPRPLGQLRTTHVTTPPQLSPRTRTSLITAGGTKGACSAVQKSVQRTTVRHCLPTLCRGRWFCARLQHLVPVLLCCCCRLLRLYASGC